MYPRVFFHKLPKKRNTFVASLSDKTYLYLSYNRLILPLILHIEEKFPTARFSHIDCGFTYCDAREYKQRHLTVRFKTNVDADFFTLYFSGGCIITPYPI